MYSRHATLLALRASVDDAAPCGELYAALIQHLDAQIQQIDVATASPSLQKIIAAAHANLAATSLFCWRRLHTDASILSALASPPLESIAALDTAIIVSGAAGEGRLDLILDIIQQTQVEHLSHVSFSQNTASFTLVDPPAIPEAAIAITSLAAPPSLVAFQSRHHNAPFILRGFARDWPALNEHSWASTAYLRSVAGPGRVVPVEIGRDYRTEDWSQKIISWDAFLNSLDANDAQPRYLAQHSLFMQFPALREDIEVPDYVYADLPRPPGCPPPQNDEQLVINAWLGPKGTVSPAHTDPYFNFYVQIAGRKTVWMAPPNCAAELHATGNTAGVDVFAGGIDSGMMASLGPGDVLYMPVGWWHAMHAESCSFSMSIWF
ncbi:Clavaminate synthase-like protein [Mycena sanguinolenta]|nr:Clavaminate synthase-like protein [Mycena sanguinolenta]